MRFSSTLTIATLFVLAGFFGAADARADHCTAHTTCADGSQISCEGQDSCSRTSSSVTCDGETTHCPEEPTCSASTTCPDGTLLFCEGQQSCQGGAPLCYVECDRSYQFCPGHFGEVFCEV